MTQHACMHTNQQIESMKCYNLSKRDDILRMYQLNKWAAIDTLSSVCHTD